MRKLIVCLLASLSLSASASADAFQFEPVRPTSESFAVVRVTLPWPDRCYPADPEVKRNGNVIEVTWTITRLFGCLRTAEPWKARAPLGVLAPGVYDIHLLVADADSGTLTTIGTRTLTVVEADPAFEVTPSFASTRGGSSLSIYSPSFCVHGKTESVSIGGRPVGYERGNCSFELQAPIHAPGSVDVTVQIDDSVFRSGAALRFVDPAATPDDSVFERVLIPIVAHTAGGYGSRWETRAELRNLSHETLPWFFDAASACAGCAAVGRGEIVDLAEFGNRPKGLLLFLPRETSGDVLFGLVVRDISRDDSTWGTEVPVVREKDYRTTRMMLAQVPFDPRYRATLRLYSVDGGPTEFLISVLDKGADEASHVRRISVEAACAEPPCNSADPGFAMVELEALFPELVGGSPVAVFVQPITTTPRPHWAFVSVTNNITQQVTTIRPQ